MENLTRYSQHLHNNGHYSHALMNEDEQGIYVKFEEAEKEKQHLKQKIRSICEAVDPHELNPRILQTALNKIYAICNRT
jgi:hypothetical protein